jgi:hypothetical protein
MAAIRDLDLISYMESGGTDGMHFRKAGVPTWGYRSIFMNPDEMYAHGLNERVPIKAFYDGLDHWSIILHELAGTAGRSNSLKCLSAPGGAPERVSFCRCSFAQADSAAQLAQRVARSAIIRVALPARAARTSGLMSVP